MIFNTFDQAQVVWIRRLVLIICLLAVSLLLLGFGGIKMELKDLKTVPCPDRPEFENLVTSSGSSAAAADCYFIQGTVVNPSKKPIYNADVFGRLYDANGNDIWPERTRLGAIEEVPPGESIFSIRISVPTTNPMPLQLEQFRASGFAGTVRR
ncbi:MAG: hypothetical protein HC921_04890 [Synechococcaceae cyanobacterium SM2_3_1]|nr:hypothetical protein [Synechococcaceae cyanobacterium SM2_3_1]